MFCIAPAAQFSPQARTTLAACAWRIAKSAAISGSCVVKLLILNRSRKRSHRRRRVCARDAPWSADPFRHHSEPLNALAYPSSADKAEVSPVVLAPGTKEVGPEGPQPGTHGRRCRHETAESDVGLSTDRTTDRLGLRNSHQQGRGAPHSRCSVHSRTRTRRGRPGSRPWVMRRTVCGASICFDANRPSCAHIGFSS